MRFSKRTVSSIEKDTTLFNYVNKNFELSFFWIESEKKPDFQKITSSLYFFFIREVPPNIFGGKKDYPSLLAN